MKILFLVWNVIVLLIYGADKLFAVKGARRISEKALLLTAFFFGGIGAMFGMVLFNHKTSKIKFRITVPFLVVLNVVLCVLLERAL